MSDEQLDKELQDLLGELTGEIAETTKAVSNPVKSKPVSGQTVSQPAPSQPAPSQPIPSQLPGRQLDKPVATQARVAIEQILSLPEDPKELLQEFVWRHNEHYEQIRQNLSVDRSKTDAVIAILMAKLQSSDASETEIESLVKALDVIARTNDSAVKLLDSRSRLISAMKSGVLIQQNISSSDSSDLQKILDDPVGDV